MGKEGRGPKEGMVDDDEDDSDEPMPHECCLHSERTLWDLRSGQSVLALTLCWQK